MFNSFWFIAITILNLKGKYSYVLYKSIIFTHNPYIKIWNINGFLPTILIFPTYNNLHKNTFIFFYFYKYFLEQRLFTTPLCSININTSVCFITIIFFSPYEMRRKQDRYYYSVHTERFFGCSLEENMFNT